jgi:hypothetical protein
MTAATFVEQFPEIFKKFDMATLIGSKGDRLHIFFDDGFGYFMNAPVMTKVNDFHSLGLKNAAHDIDGRIVPVEK